MFSFLRSLVSESPTCSLLPYTVQSTVEQLLQAHGAAGTRLRPSDLQLMAVSDESGHIHSVCGHTLSLLLISSSALL